MENDRLHPFLILLNAYTDALVGEAMNDECGFSWYAEAYKTERESTYNKLLDFVKEVLR